MKQSQNQTQPNLNLDLNLSPNLLSRPDRNYTPLIKGGTYLTLIIQVLFLTAILANFMLNKITENADLTLQKNFNALSTKTDVFNDTFDVKEKIEIYTQEQVYKDIASSRLQELTELETANITITSINLTLFYASLNVETDQALQGALFLRKILDNPKIEEISLKSATFDTGNKFNLSLDLRYK